MIISYVIRTGLLHRILSVFEKFLTGCLLSSPDGRDVMFEPESRGHAPKTDLSRYLRKNLYQGPVGSCSAHGVIHALMIAENKIGWHREVPSRRYNYWWARYYSEKGVPKGLKGCSIRNAFQAVHEKGLPDERFWNYSHKAPVLNTTPNGLASYRGSSRIGSRYAFIPYDGRVNMMKQALSEGKAVVFGADISSRLRKTKPNEVVYPPRFGEGVGKHCMCVVGHDDDAHTFTVLNSWRGKEIFTFHESYFAGSRVFDVGVWTL